MSYDYSGACPHCSTLNAYTAFNCRACGQRLPWADALTLKLFEGQRVATDLMQQGQVATPIISTLPLPPYQSQPTALQNPCPHCGAAYSSSANYCPSCGIRIWEGMAFNPPLWQPPPPNLSGAPQLATPQKGNFTFNFVIVVFVVFMASVIYNTGLLFGLTWFAGAAILLLCFAALCRLSR